MEIIETQLLREQKRIKVRRKSVAMALSKRRPRGMPPNVRANSTSTINTIVEGSKQATAVRIVEGSKQATAVSSFPRRSVVANLGPLSEEEAASGSTNEGVGHASIAGGGEKRADPNSVRFLQRSASHPPKQMPRMAASFTPGQTKKGGKVRLSQVVPANSPISEGVGNESKDAARNRPRAPSGVRFERRGSLVLSDKGFNIPSPRANGTKMIESIEHEEELMWKHFVFIPQSTFKSRWDAVLAVLILYSVISIPYRMGLDVPAEGAWYWFDRAVDIMFGIDMIFSARTAYSEEQSDVYQTDSSKMLSNYLEGWFTIDFFSTVPIDIIVESATGSVATEVRSLKLIRTVRLVRLLKLARLLKLSKFMENIDDYIDIGPATIRQASLVGLDLVARL